MIELLQFVTQSSWHFFCVFMLIWVTGTGIAEIARGCWGKE